MDEIRMLVARLDAETLDQGMGARGGQPVPANMRDLEARIGGRKAPHLAGNPVETRSGLVLVTARRHELHADADAEKRLGIAAHGAVERLRHAGDGGNPIAAVAT